MGKHPGAYRGDKKRKEISRHKKQEEKRQRRFNKGKESAAGETTAVENTEMDIRNEETGTEDTTDQKNEPGEEAVS